MADSPSVTKAHSRNVPESDVLGYSRAPRLFCCALLAFAIAHAPLVSLAAGRQLPLAPIDLLPNAPTTYQMRDWHQVATDFDTLAFNTTATGQFLPLVRIDNTPATAPASDVVRLAGLCWRNAHLRRDGRADPRSDRVAGGRARRDARGRG